MSVYLDMSQHQNRQAPQGYNVQQGMSADHTTRQTASGRPAGMRKTVTQRLRGVVTTLALSLMALTGVALAPAAAGPVLVADIDSGRVLYAKQATDPWYPASVTKLMTAYLTLHAMRTGRLRSDTPLVVSARAASAKPSKMGFKPGVEVTVDNALKMLMVKSANDMAVVLAEGVGGSVEQFADMMNEAAQELGMGQSHFVNPNGLPDPDNRSSARDLAVLGRAILRQFPEYSEYFNIEAVQLGKRTYKNTNGLVGRYPGVTGMKTGFICSSGFNVVATATRGNRRLMVVVLGAHSGVERTLMAAALFDRGFADSGWGGPGTLDTLPLPASVTPPDMRDSICGGGGARGEEEAENGGANVSPLMSLFKGSNSDWEKPVAGRTLPPRAVLAAIPVFTGRYPGAAADIAVATRRGRAQKGETASAYAADEPDVPAGAKALQRVKRPTGKKADARKQEAAQKSEKAEKAAKTGKAEKAQKDEPKKARPKKAPARDTKKKPTHDE